MTCTGCLWPVKWPAFVPQLVQCLRCFVFGLLVRHLCNRCPGLLPQVSLCFIEPGPSVFDDQMPKSTGDLPSLHERLDTAQSKTRRPDQCVGSSPPARARAQRCLPMKFKQKTRPADYISWHQSRPQPPAVKAAETTGLGMHRGRRLPAGFRRPRKLFASTWKFRYPMAQVP